MVFRPEGAKLITFNANSQQQLTLPDTGTYIIQVHASDLVSTGAYSLGLEGLLPTSPVDATLACGGLLSRPINASAKGDQITFNGQTDAKVTLTLTEIFFLNDTATTEIYSLPPHDALPTFNANSQQQLTLPDTGTYIIQVPASNLVSTGAYSL